MADALARSGMVAPCGRRFAICESRRGVDGKRFLTGSWSRRSADSVESLRFSSGSEFRGMVVEKNWRKTPKSTYQAAAVPTQMALSIGKAMKWWEKGIQPNMKEITSAQDLVDSLNNAGDQLVIVDFFSPGCAGCRALHPKICQFAEMNPDVQFLQINHEKHKSMCYSLNVHVLPFFRFYRGAQGRLCSFSCTNATIKKFKDALAKHGTERCSLGSAKGLEEAELMALSANKDLAFTYAGGSEAKPELVTGPAMAPPPLNPPAAKPSEKAPVVTAWR